MATSIFSRKRDLAYMVYFALGIPIAFAMDLQPIYPPHLLPEILVSLKDFYVRNYNDQFYINTPNFFRVFLWIEFVYQVPVMIWGLGGLYRNSPKVPLILLPFAVKVFLTTLTCMLEFPNFPIPLEKKISLTTLYGPYLAVSAFMMIDMYLRLKKVIDNQVFVQQQTVVKKLL
ncbi:transmembrane protein 6/97 [Amylocarpus encephaloides]|uniref:Efficient mitochondria targeting-associated protein 19 n=1 Tax=Amylocarpus encephaloides TaxID=45428 RepID=A0A9P7YT74_9HELO|nr:transmembrane protein 6/97 [Amylocarpus encephaloides]